MYLIFSCSEVHIDIKQKLQCCYVKYLVHIEVRLQHYYGQSLRVTDIIEKHCLIYLIHSLLIVLLGA